MHINETDKKMIWLVGPPCHTNKATSTTGQTFLSGHMTHRVGRVLSFSPVVGIGTTPTPRPQASVPPPPCSGGRGTLDGERGVGRVLVPTRGHTLWYSLYIRTLCSRPLRKLITFITKRAPHDHIEQYNHPDHSDNQWENLPRRYLVRIHNELYLAQPLSLKLRRLVPPPPPPHTATLLISD